MPATVIWASDTMPPYPARNVRESAIRPRARDWAPIWKVKNGVATQGYASTASRTSTWRAPTRCPIQRSRRAEPTVAPDVPGRAPGGDPVRGERRRAPLPLEAGPGHAVRRAPAFIALRHSAALTRAAPAGPGAGRPAPAP